MLSGLRGSKTSYGTMPEPSLFDVSKDWLLKHFRDPSSQGALADRGGELVERLSARVIAKETEKKQLEATMRSKTLKRQPIAGDKRKWIQCKGEIESLQNKIFTVAKSEGMMINVKDDAEIAGHLSDVHAHLEREKKRGTKVEQISDILDDLDDDYGDEEVRTGAFNDAFARDESKYSEMMEDDDELADILSSAAEELEIREGPLSFPAVPSVGREHPESNARRTATKPTTRGSGWDEDW